MKNIVLIGMPACGKSTMGVVLAKTLGMRFVDTDLLIQEKEKRKLQDIINKDGMEAFLRTEENVLSSLNAENSVISTGGSAIYSGKAMKHLAENGCIVYIKLSLAEIERRLKNIRTRGIAMKPGESLADLYAQRIPFYEKYADITIETEGMGIEESVEFLVKKLGN